jgi:hypothetical protein
MTEITRNGDSSSHPSGGARTRLGGFPAAIVLQERVCSLEDKSVSKRVAKLLQDLISSFYKTIDFR